MMRQLLVLLLCLIVQAWVPAMAKGVRIWVATSGNEAPYREAVAVLRDRLSNHEVVVRPWSEFLSVREPAPRLVLTLGAEAANRMTEASAEWPKTVVVAMLLSRANLEKLADDRPGRVTGVYFDQPFSRLATLLRLAMPDRERIGALFGPSSQPYEGEFRQALKVSGLEPQVEAVKSREELPAGVRTVLDEADVLLAVPDTLVHNSQSAHFILLSAYKRGVPLIGYSESFVRAGAVAALVSTPEQIASQGADLAADLLGGGEVPPPRRPEGFRVMVNGNVARSLGIALDAEALERKLGMRERRP